MTSSLSNPRKQIYDKTYSLLSDPSLSYSDYTKGFILHHLCDLIDGSPRIAEANTGNSPVNLLHADVVIQYGHNNRSSVAVVICFVGSYPICRPVVRVTCPDIHIIIPHQHIVAPCGAVSHPYLLNWNHEISNVRKLVGELAEAFGEAFGLSTFLDRPGLDRVLTPPEVKLAKILIENGLNDLYCFMCNKDNKTKKDFFAKINLRYRKHPHLEEFINSTPERLAKFIGIAKDVAKELLPGAPETVGGGGESSSGTRGYSNAPCQLGIPSGRRDQVCRLIVAPDSRYEKDDKKKVFGHLCDLVSYYPSLGVTKVDGLIQVHGTIPYSYEGQYYSDVDVKICLLKPYPGTRPRAFVSSSRGNCIRNDLLNVSPNGYVYCSYLRNWDASKSNLAGLVSHLCAIFSCQPPKATARTSPLEKAPQDGSRNIRPCRPPSSHGSSTPASFSP